MGIMAPEESVTHEMLACFHPGQLTVTILIQGHQKQFQLLLSLDLKTLLNPDHRSVNIIDDHVAALTKAVPTLFKWLLVHSLNHVSHTHFPISQVVLTRVFAKDIKELIGLNGVHLSITNELGIGQEFISVFIDRIPGMLIEFEQRLLMRPLFLFSSMLKPVIYDPHFPEFNRTVLVRVIPLEEFVDKRIDFPL